jgi:hypothetical protein
MVSMLGWLSHPFMLSLLHEVIGFAFSLGGLTIDIWRCNSINPLLELTRLQFWEASRVKTNEDSIMKT